jgi:hypothetical protein
MNDAREPTWPASLAVLAVIALQLTLAERLSFGPTWLAPGFELALLIVLQISAPHRRAGEARWLRVLTIALLVLINIANASSLVLLIEFLLDGSRKSGESLFFNALSLWSTNVFAFALWYWELDRGGPAGGAATHVIPTFYSRKWPMPSSRRTNGIRTSSITSSCRLRMPPRSALPTPHP